MDRSIQDRPCKGACVGPCKLTHKLGAGGFGRVLSSVNTQSGETEAVKFIAKSDISTVGQATALWGEILHHGKLEHPHIARQIQVLHGPTNIVIRMEEAGRKNLFAYMNAEGIRPLPLDVSRSIQKQVCDAIAYCHNQGVAHRDIKPENIGINADTLEVKIIDFGCCVRTDALRADVAGSLPFIAPEVFTAGPRSAYAPAPTDVFACGVLLTEMLCGSDHLSRAMKWNRSTPVERCRREELAAYLADDTHVLQDVRMAARCVVDGDGGVAELLLGALAVNPKARWVADRLASNDWLRGL